MNDTIKPFKIWIAGIIVMIFFCIFKGLEAAYVSQLFRSWILVIVFNSIFSDKIKKIDKI